MTAPFTFCRFENSFTTWPLRNRYVFTSPIVAMLLAALSICGCEDTPTSEQLPSPKELKATVSNLTEGLGGQLKGATDSVKELLGPSPGNTLHHLTTEQVSKLFKWEYHVEDIPSASESDVLNSKLTTLGGQNWECANLMVIGDKIRLVCKRRPPSALSYLKQIPGM